MMSWQDAALLGAIQGLTEFLPVSSSGHLRIFESLCHHSLSKQSVLFEIFLHGITFLVILFVLRHQVIDLFKNPKKLGWLFLSSLSTVVVVFAFGLKEIFESANLTMVLLAEGVTGLFLLLSHFIFSRRGERSLLPYGWGVILMGLVQGLAVIPGLSRSGMTIGTAFLLGWKREEAFSFSFLMSLPVIGGAMILSFFELSGSGRIQSSVWIYVMGALPAVFFGVVTLMFLRSWVLRSLKPFGFYCLSLSALGFFFLEGSDHE